MAINFLHSSAIVEAVIDVLEGADGASHTGGLPVNWFVDDGTEDVLKTLEHGDMMDVVYDPDKFSGLLPAIFVKSISVVPEGGGLTGMLDTRERVRVVHVRRRDQTHQAGTYNLEDNIPTAKERYAKIIADALFNDPHRKLATVASAGTRTAPTLTAASGETAKVWNHTFVSMDYGGGMPDTQWVDQRRELDAWAIAIDSDVHVWTG